MAEFTLANNQRAERKTLITVAEWLDGSTPVREFLGTRTPDSTVDYNLEVTTETDILGNNFTDVESTQPQQDFDPFVILGGSKLGAKLNEIRRRNAISELNQFTVYLITAFVDENADTSGLDPAYQAEKHVDCTITYNSIGGDTTVNFPISVYFSNKSTLGTVNALDNTFTFTPDA